MTPDHLRQWQADMGYTDRAAADALGMAPRNYQQLKRGTSYSTGKPVTIDRRTALACAALRAGIPPEGGDE